MTRAAAQAGLDGFDALVRRHERAVFAVCRAILRDEHLGLDATQETFVRLWNSLRAGRAPDDCTAWLKRTAVTSAIDVRRRREVRERAQAFAHAPTPSEPAPPQVAGQAELEARLEAALDDLSEGQRTVFLLRHSGGNTLAEIATLLELEPSTVKTQFARACLKLQVRLSSFDPRGEPR